MAKVTLFQCDLPGCENTSPEEMEEILIPSYDEETDSFYQKNVMLCSYHYAKYETFMDQSITTVTDHASDGAKKTAAKKKRKEDTSSKNNESHSYGKEQDKKDLDTSMIEDLFQGDPMDMDVIYDHHEEESKDFAHTHLPPAEQPDPEKEDKEDKDAIMENVSKITLNSETQRKSPFYNMHTFKIAKNGNFFPEKFRLYIIPLKICENRRGIDIAAMLEISLGSVIKKQVCLVSDKKARLSVQFDDSERGFTIVIRGKWSEKRFITDLYIRKLTQNEDLFTAEDHEVKHYHPDQYNAKDYVRNFKYEVKDEDLLLSVYPISQTNNPMGYVKMLAVSETKYQRAVLTDTNGIIDMTFKGKKYALFGSWQNNRFCMSLEERS